MTTLPLLSLVAIPPRTPATQTGQSAPVDVGVILWSFGGLLLIGLIVFGISAGVQHLKDAAFERRRNQTSFAPPAQRNDDVVGGLEASRRNAEYLASSSLARNWPSFMDQNRQDERPVLDPSRLTSAVLDEREGVGARGDAEPRVPAEPVASSGASVRWDQLPPAPSEDAESSLRRADPRVQVDLDALVDRLEMLQDQAGAYAVHPELAQWSAVGDDLILRRALNQAQAAREQASTTLHRSDVEYLHSRVNRLETVLASTEDRVAQDHAAGEPLGPDALEDPSRHPRAARQAVMRRS